VAPGEEGGGAPGGARPGHPIGRGLRLSGWSHRVRTSTGRGWRREGDSRHQRTGRKKGLGRTGWVERGGVDILPGIFVISHLHRSARLVSRLRLFWDGGSRD
jgi:hypothetical protein